MSKLVGIVVVLILGYLAITSYGQMFGMSSADMQSVEIYKNRTIEKAEPIIGQVLSKQEISALEKKMKDAMPTAAEVNDTMQNQVVPTIVNAAKKIGDAAQADLARNSSRDQE